jgi:hypothetical protein
MCLHAVVEFYVKLGTHYSAVNRTVENRATKERCFLICAISSFFPNGCSFSVWQLRFLRRELWRVLPSESVAAQSARSLSVLWRNALPQSPGSSSICREREREREIARAGRVLNFCLTTRLQTPSDNRHPHCFLFCFAYLTSFHFRLFQEQNYYKNNHDARPIIILLISLSVALCHIQKSLAHSCTSWDLHNKKRELVFFILTSFREKASPFETHIKGSLAHMKRIMINNNNSVALFRERTIPTERPRHGGEVSANFCGTGCRVVRAADPYVSNLGLLDRSNYFFFQVAPQFYSRGWVDPVSDPLLLRKLWAQGVDAGPLDM